MDIFESEVTVESPQQPVSVQADEQGEMVELLEDNTKIRRAPSIEADN